MKKTESLLKAVITLPKDFEITLNYSMEDELQIAQRKWEVELTEDQQDRVFDLSVRQLENKVLAVTKFPWKIGMENIEITIGSTSEKEVYLPTKENDGQKINEYIIRSNEDWKLDDAPTANSTALKDLHLRVAEDIEKWLRTAVFYSVGSYSR